ncbi:MurR/RpiR family transcriptional regulator [Cucumibacter marinus]|uniref:MurR/RpiR family transcriptional regulator n=1 Tax=Cucumibacter marinus TaxID=1121252 RepID=UPI00040265C5|nr:MurR/RpiR family transcriptional regulator [Cucumibacter marinus]
MNESGQRTAAGGFRSATRQLRGRLPSLSDSEKRVALWVLENVPDVLRQSMSAIARTNNVSDTTVLRMCRTAGFNGFTDLKLALAADPEAGAAATAADGAPDGDIERARRVFRGHYEALNDTAAALDEAGFTSAIDMLTSAKHILVGGIGGSGIVAQALYQRCYRLGMRCDAPIDNQLQLMHASLLEPGDLVVAISYSGITSDPILLLEEARRQGAATLCITGNQRSPLAKLADTVLISVSHEPGSEPMAAQVAQLTLVDALYSAIAARNAENTQRTEERMVNAILPKSIR